MHVYSNRRTTKEPTHTIDVEQRSKELTHIVLDEERKEEEEERKEQSNNSTRDINDISCRANNQSIYIRLLSLSFTLLVWKRRR